MVGAVNVTDDPSSHSLENRFGGGGMAAPGGYMITWGKMAQMSGVVRSNPGMMYFVDRTQKWFADGWCMRCDRGYLRMTPRHLSLVAPRAESLHREKHRLAGEWIFAS